LPSSSNRPASWTARAALASESARATTNRATSATLRPCREPLRAVRADINYPFRSRCALGDRGEASTSRKHSEPPHQLLRAVRRRRRRLAACSLTPEIVPTPPRRGIAFCGNSVMMKSKPAASTFQKPVRRVVGGKYENAQMRLRSDAHGAAPERSRFGPLHDQSRSWIPRARGRRVAVLESYAVLGIITLPITPRPCRAR